MIAKRALIVDDSKSALFVLKRMLKDLNLEVDTVQSAFDAIDYLEHHRPDVIFMDHMMPGMDGFEAVKRIKENSETAVIPIMMYTTRGGDVYLSQARALGAVGIIPKTISPVDLKESLLKLGLIEDIQIKSSLILDEATTTKINERVIIDEPIDGQATKDKDFEDKVFENQDVLDTYINDLGRLMDDQTIELHKSMWLGIESVSNEIFNRLNSELEERFDNIHPTSGDETPDQTSLDVKKVTWPLYVVSAFLLLSIIINVSLLFKNNRLENKLASTPEEIIIPFVEEQNTDKDVVGNQREKFEFIKQSQNKMIEYPFDELALNDRRLPIIEELVDKALEAGFTGSIILQTHAGKFCLSSDNNGKYNLAADDLSITNCEYIGNYIQQNDEPSTHQSLGFANYLSDLNSLNKKGIVIEITNVARKSELAKYPKQVSDTTVKQWNQAAQLNNRITILLKPTFVDSL